MCNHLKKGDFQVDGKLVRWQYITDFYNFDKSYKICMTPKLTNRHIDLPPFTSMHVNLAVQVLNHSIAAGITFLTRVGELPESAKYTAQFVELLICYLTLSTINH